MSLISQTEVPRTRQMVSRLDRLAQRARSHFAHAKGVRVNAVSPGPTCTEGTAAVGDALRRLAAQAPSGRPAELQEIAEVILFLASDRAI